jgi:hypothetical protein
VVQTPLAEGSTFTLSASYETTFRLAFDDSPLILVEREIRRDSQDPAQNNCALDFPPNLL